MKNEELLLHLSTELARTQMINKALVTLLEKKGILTEQEVLDELSLVIEDTLKEYTDKVEKQEQTKTILSNFWPTKTGKA